VAAADLMMLERGHVALRRWLMRSAICKHGRQAFDRTSRRSTLVFEGVNRRPVARAFRPDNLDQGRLEVVVQAGKLCFMVTSGAPFDREDDRALRDEVAAIDGIRRRWSLRTINPRPISELKGSPTNSVRASGARPRAGGPGRHLAPNCAE